MTERVLCSRQADPHIDALIRARRQAVERIAVLLRILVDLIDLVEPAVVGILQMGRHEQEGIALVVEHLLRDVLAIVYPFDEEVGIG